VRSQQTAPLPPLADAAAPTFCCLVLPGNLALLCAGLASSTPPAASSRASRLSRLLSLSLSSAHTVTSLTTVRRAPLGLQGQATYRRMLLCRPHSS
jgi:hypothetical protein